MKALIIQTLACPGGAGHGHAMLVSDDGKTLSCTFKGCSYYKKVFHAPSVELVPVEPGFSPADVGDEIHFPDNDVAVKPGGMVGTLSGFTSFNLPLDVTVTTDRDGVTFSPRTTANHELGSSSKIPIRPFTKDPK